MRSSKVVEWVTEAQNKMVESCRSLMLMHLRLRSASVRMRDTSRWYLVGATILPVR